MELPKIDLGSLPDLDAATGLFGSFSEAADDTIVAIMVYVYDHVLVEMLL